VDNFGRTANDSQQHGVMSKLLGAATARTRTLDPRLLIGVLLVVASVAGVYTVVTSADRSATVYLAREALLPGVRISPDDLVESGVKDDETAKLYLAPGDLPAAGLVVIRTVAAGELVPRSALGDPAGLRLTSVVVTVDGQLGAAVGPGSIVDLWAAAVEDGERIPTPDVIVPGAVVVRLLASESIVAGRQTTAVEVLVPRDRTARLLEALANGDAMSVVAADLPAGG
jgi:hypothetical protein